MNEEQIEFNKTRDFSETLNVSFAFIKQNFKLFFTTLLFLVGPVLLLNSILSGIYLKNQLDFSHLVQGNRTPSDIFSPIYFFIIIFSMAANIMLMGIVYEFVMLYEKKGYGNFNTRDVWNEFVTDLGLIFTTLFFLIGILIAFAVVFGAISFLLIKVGTGGIIVFSMLIIGIMFALGPPLAFIFSAIYPIRIRERISNFDALSKAYELTKANFGSTWITIFVSYIIVVILALILTIPSGIATRIVALNSGSDTSDISTFIVTIFNVIANFGGSLINTIILIIICFHYFSLNEKENGDGLLEKINKIGEQETNNEDITI